MASLSGCGVDPDVDIPTPPDSVDGAGGGDVASEADSGEDSGEVVNDASHDGNDAAADTVDVAADTVDVAEPVFCDGHCDCLDNEYCSTASGTCQLIVGLDVYYCCEDSGDNVACPQGQACHVPGTFGNSGTCDAN